MSQERFFEYARCMQPSDGEPIRSVVTETAECVVVAWHVKPGQTIAPHVHPFGQDTWTILSGAGDYIVGRDGAKRPIKAGDIVVARTNDVHGVFNSGHEPLNFISVVAPASAGYELLS
ncbi:MAG: cupin domain-containing protein [Gammaproteobacteria bacterium]|nr:cupin domain-containing protein [Gammaproteobacteria bacterium]